MQFWALTKLLKNPINASIPSNIRHNFYHDFIHPLYIVFVSKEFSDHKKLIYDHSSPYASGDDPISFKSSLCVLWFAIQATIFNVKNSIASP